MKRIIIHWTAGGYYPNAVEKHCYHFLVDSDGCVHNGDFVPEANLVCKKGCYAAHTGGGNTSSIGVAICGMRGFKNKNNLGDSPILQKQFEATMMLCAKLAEKYKIQPYANKIMTHYEFGIKNPNTSSAGKIDITYIPPYSWVEKNEVGSFIRSKIRWYLAKLKED